MRADRFITLRIDRHPAPSWRSTASRPSRFWRATAASCSRPATASICSSMPCWSRAASRRSSCRIDERGRAARAPRLRAGAPARPRRARAAKAAAAQPPARAHGLPRRACELELAARCRSPRRASPAAPAVLRSQRGRTVMLAFANRDRRAARAAHPRPSRAPARCARRRLEAVLARHDPRACRSRRRASPSWRTIPASGCCTRARSAPTAQTLAWFEDRLDPAWRTRNPDLVRGD